MKNLIYILLISLICFIPYRTLAQTPEYGVTVIVHGFAPFGNIDGSWTSYAQKIRARVNNNATIYKNDAYSNKWRRIEGNGDLTKEIILVYDWAALSNSSNGNLQAAADLLFASLFTPIYIADGTNADVYGQNIITGNKKLHFIGHSRGCILLLQLLHRIGVHSDTRRIDHLTLLDPHPATSFGDVASEQGLYQSLPGVTGSATGCRLTLGCSNVNTVKIKIPSNVDHADHYYRQDGLFEGGTDVGSFDGVEVEGISPTYSRKLVNASISNSDCGFFGGAHSIMHKWYGGTINTQETLCDGTPSDWYLPSIYVSPTLSSAESARTATGYNHSRLGGGSMPDAPVTTISMDDMTTQLGTTGRNEGGLQPISNRNFAFGNVGWYKNNDGIGQFPQGAARLGYYKPKIENGRVTEIEYLSAELKHYPFYFPKKNARNENNEFLIFTAKSYLGTGKGIQVTFFDSNNKPLGSIYRKKQAVTDTKQVFYCPIPETLKGKVGSFSVQSYYNAESEAYYIEVDDFVLTSKTTGVELTTGMRDPNQNGDIVLSPLVPADVLNAVSLYRDSADNNFQHLSNSAWYKSYAEDGAKLGLFEGDTLTANFFDPTIPLKRDETVSNIVNSALKLGALRGGNLDLSTTNGTFTDVPETHRYFPYIQALRNLGYLNINATNTFNPNTPVTLGQFCKILSLAYWDNTPSSNTQPNVHSASQFNVQLAPNTNPDYIPHVYRILNTFTLKKKGNRRWVERIFNFKVNASGTGYDNVIDTDAPLTRVAMTKAMTNVFEYRRNELIRDTVVSNYTTLGEKWELPETVSGVAPDITSITTSDFYMTAGANQAFIVNTNLSNPHYYWAIDGGAFTTNNSSFSNVTFTAPAVPVVTTFNLYVYAGSTAGSAIEFTKKIIVKPIIAPTELAATTTSTRTAQISWQDNESVETGYVLEYSLGGGFQQVALLPANTTTYTHTGLPTHAIVQYRVKAVVQQASSRYSNIGAVNLTTSPKQVNQLEYFIDTDPGFGNGTTISVSAGRDVTQLLDIPTSALAEGVHVLHVRAKDNQNRWSMPYLYPFVKPASGGALEMNRVEYFLDTDPGFGNGVTVPTSQWSDLVQPTVVFNVPLQNVSNGIHTLHVRVRDTRGKWSNVHAQSFARFEGVGIGNQRVIEKLEYFIDTEPGLGSGTDVAITGQDSIIDKSFNVNLNNVTNGIHTLHVRVRDNAGKWSNIHQQIFLRTQGNGVGTAIIQQMECFIDEDPGLGQATNIPVTAAAQVEPSFNVNLSQVNNGVHALHVRAKDNYGKWSSISVHPFVKVSGNSGNSVITRVEYFWDTDPGLGNATTMSFTGTTEAIVQQSISLASVSSGRHRFYVRAKDANERWSTIFNDTVHVNPTWIRVNMTVTPQSTRCGLSNGSIQITATSGTAPYEYALNNGTFQASNAFSNLASGSYVVKIRDRDGYLGEQTATVGASTPLSVTITPSAAELNCTTNSITLRASTGTTYLWDNSSTAVTRTITTAGTYAVTVTDANGCIGNRSITITNNTTEPVANITAPSLELNCTTSSIVLTASGGTYRWDNNATTATRTVTTAGTYTVTVTGSNGCFVTRNITVTSNTAAPNAAITAPTTELNCATTSIILTASGGNTYRWNNNATTADRTITTAGTYTVTVTGTNGCLVVRTIVITSNTTVPTAVINTPATELTCTNPSILLTASGGGTYRWENNATTADRTVTSAGNYTVTVTNANGCSATRSITITANANIPTVSITAPTTELTCSVTSIALTASGGGTYAWDNNATSVGRTITAAGNYMVTVTSSTGCTVARTITITANTTPPNAVINAPTTVLSCSTSSIALTASGGGTYRWNNNATTSTINATTAGLYTVTVTGSNGCTATITKTITINADLRPTIIGNLNICGNGSTTLTASNGSTYLWSGGQTTASITIAQAGTYSVTVSTSATCTGVTSVQITNTSLPNAVISGNTSICQDSSSVLTASGGSIYQWSNGQTTSAITVSQATSYTVTVTDGNGCTNTRTVQTSIVAKPTANFTFVANSLRVVFTNNSVGGITYLWNFGNGVTSTESNPTINYTAAGSYIVMLTVTNNCGSRTYQQTVVTTTSINEIENALQLSLYPNPNDGRFTIVFKNAVPELTLEIQNVLGQNVWSQKVLAGTKQLDIQLPNRSVGVYMVKFYKKGQLVGNEKLVVSE